MHIFRILALLGALAITSDAAAQTTPVATVQCIATCSTYLTGTNLAGAPIVLVQGWHAAGDGGGGEFYLFDSMNACAPASLDDGTAFTNTYLGASSCYHRRFTGTVYMSWFGVQNSIWSGTAWSNDVSTACTTANPNCWTNAFNAAASASLGGNNIVSTGGMLLYSTQDVTPNANQTLTCDAPYLGAQAGANFSNVKGGIVLGQNAATGLGASIHVLSDNDEFHHCVVLSAGSANPINPNPGACGTDAAIQRCALTNVQNMVANGDVGVICDGPENNYIHDLLVVGFDTGIASFSCSRWRADGVNTDASVGIYWQNNKSPSYVNNVNVFPFMVSGLTPKQKDTASNVVGIGSDGGLCKLTTSAPANIITGDWVSLAGDKLVADEGPLSCYGTFKATKIDSTSTHFDLQGTVYGDNTAPFRTTPGNWPLHSSVINVATVAGIEAGQCVTSSDTAFSGYGCITASGTVSNSVMVKDVSYYSNKVVIDQPTQTATGSSPPTLSFTNYGPYTSSTSTLYLYASSRIDAGNSIAGAGAGNVAICFMGGGPGDSSSLGILGSNNYCFAHRMQYNFNSVGPAVCTGCGFDTQAELFDIKQIGVRFGHGTDPLVLSAIPSAGVSNTTLNGIELLSGLQQFNPQYAGWKIGDTVISSSGDVNNQTIIAISSSTITITGVVSGLREAFYDVKPLILTGDTTSGSPIISNLSGNPHPATGTQWNIGDAVLTPTTGDIPSGARIVSYSHVGCPPTCSVTLNMNATHTDTTKPVVDLAVWTPVNTASAEFLGSSLSGGGGLVFDSATTTCNVAQGVSINTTSPGQPGLEVVQGCMMLDNVSEAQSNDFMIDAGVTNVLMSASRTGPTGLAGIFFEGDQAAQAFAGAGNLLGGGGQSNMMTFGDSSGANKSMCPPTSRSVVVVFCGGDALGVAGNTYESCNPQYAASGTALCPGTFLNKLGVLTHTNSSNNPVFEFNDATQALMPLPYEDGIQANLVLSSMVLIAAVNVVTSCFNSGCTSDGVTLPVSTGWVDAAAMLSGSDCSASSTRRCGVAGGITVINANSTNPITVWCRGPDTVINLSSCGMGVSLPARTSKTFFPVKPGTSTTGWISN